MALFLMRHSELEAFQAANFVFLEVSVETNRANFPTFLLEKGILLKEC